MLDPGYSTTRAGWAGEDVPKCVFSSFFGEIKKPTDKGGVDTRTIFGDDVLLPRPGLEMRNYMGRDGLVEDWDAATEMWEHMLVKRLQPERPGDPRRNGLNDLSEKEKTEGGGNGEDADMADADDIMEKALEENPLLISEPAWNTPKQREKLAEVVMESWGCPAFYVCKTPVLAAFAAGKPWALVVDVGASGTSVVAVHDGFILKRSVQRSPVGGLWLSSQIRSMWESSDPRVEIVPTFMVENKTPVDAGAPAQCRLRTFPFPISDSFRAYEEERVLTEFKESVVEVWRGPGRYNVPGNEEFVRSQPGRVFEMPDGYNQMWREQRYRVSEGMWDDAVQYPPAGGDESLRLTKAQTIPELIRSCLNGVDVDLRGNLLGNVVVTGATTLLNGFNDRLNQELANMFPGVKIKIHAAGLTTDRRFGAWIGGSILASLGTFHQMWISRKEYEENGAGIVEKRCK